MGVWRIEPPPPAVETVLVNGVCIAIEEGWCVCEVADPDGILYHLIHEADAQGECREWGHTPCTCGTTAVRCAGPWIRH